jgi:hypothetical protein
MQGGYSSGPERLVEASRAARDTHESLRAFGARPARILRSRRTKVQTGGSSFRNYGSQPDWRMPFPKAG